MRWFTADLHLGHANIIRYCNRPFVDAEQMNEVLIKNWNDVVGKDDEVYVLGDFAFVKRVPDTVAYMERLNGNITLIRGNHDNKCVRKAFGKDCVECMRAYIGPYHCVLTHRPLYPDGCTVPPRDISTQEKNAEWFTEYDFVISGHIHDLRLWTGKSLNVGVDLHNFRPISEEEVAAFLDGWRADNN